MNQRSFPGPSVCILPARAESNKGIPGLWEYITSYARFPWARPSGTAASIVEGHETLSRLVVVISVHPRVEAIFPSLFPLQHLDRIVAHAEVFEQRELEVLPEVLRALAVVEFVQLLVSAVF